jgi:hypothetical protein
VGLLYTHYIRIGADFAGILFGSVGRGRSDGDYLWGRKLRPFIPEVPMAGGKVAINWNKGGLIMLASWMDTSYCLSVYLFCFFL